MDSLYNSAAAALQAAIPENVAYILSRLNENGYEACVVGGCVRDELLGHTPDDWDITTSATPDEVKKVFHRTADTGIKHGTVGVLLGGKAYEVTTYRIDGEYEDGRHPKDVTFTPDLTKDLKRRDFTINAMAYSPRTGLIDEFGGVDDLKSGIIRCVGDPMERFGEDALRILRAIRFSAQLGFDIDADTYAAICEKAPDIAKVSKERVQAELTKLLLSAHPEKIKEVYETGISDYVSPAFALIPWQNADIDSSLPAKKYIRWAAFLRPASPDQAEEVLRDLKLDNETIADVKKLVSWNGRQIDEEPAALRHAMSQLSPELWDAFLDLSNASENLRKLTEDIRSRGDCLSLSELAVTGDDLIKAGVKPGKNMGRILSSMLDKVLDDPAANSKEILLQTLEKPCT